MLKFLLARLAGMVPVIIVVTFLVFGLVLLIPGDPALTIAGGQQATPEAIAAIRQSLGLDQPFLVQYWNWATSALVGDLGSSLFNSRAVSTSIAESLPVTLALTLTAIVISLLISIPLAIFSALRPGGVLDRLVTLTSSVAIALPAFWVGLMLVLVFSLQLGWLPATGYVPLSEDPLGWLKHIVLPATTLAVAASAESTRQLRGSVIDVLKQDYVRTAYAKGLRRPAVIGKHVMKNASVPLVTIIGLQVSLLLGGAVVIEQVFGVPGIGKVAVGAVTTRDLPVVQGVVLVAVVVTMACNLLVDLAYGYLNPKVRPR